MSETKKNFNQMIAQMERAFYLAKATATGTTAQRRHYCWAHALAVTHGTYCFAHNGHPAWNRKEGTIGGKLCTICNRYERIP